MAKDVPSSNLPDSLAQLRSNGWSGPAKLTVRTREGDKLEYVQEADGSWRLYGQPDADSKWLREVASTNDLDTYLRALQPEWAETAARRPLIVTSGTKNGSWRIHLSEFREMSTIIGEDSFAAFLKCFVASDRLRSFLQFYFYCMENVPKDSPAADRNAWVHTVMVVGTLHELGVALEELSMSTVYSAAGAPPMPEALQVLLAQWHRHPVGKRLRNEAGHHLGYLKTWRRGLAKLSESVIDLDLHIADGQHPHAGFFKGAWDVLLTGLTMQKGSSPEITLDDLKQLADEMAQAQRDLHPALAGAFIDVLESNGVLVAHFASD